VRVGDGGRWVYTLFVMEGYSHKIPAGMSTEYQDTVAMLQLLAAALAEYGRPAGMVSDNGSVFTSEVYEGLLGALGIEVCHIEKGKPWENLAEALFKTELRLADARFERAETVEEIQEQHAAFVEVYNTTPHWAHRHLHVAARDVQVARDAYRYDRKAWRLRAVERHELHHTVYTIQSEFWELDDAQWRKVVPRSYERREPSCAR